MKCAICREQMTINEAELVVAVRFLAGKQAGAESPTHLVACRRGTCGVELLEQLDAILKRDPRPGASNPPEPPRSG